MPKTEGHIEEINKINNDGNTFLVLTIDGTEFYLHDNSLFNEVSEGDDIGVQFEKNESGGNVYRNINEINHLGASSGKFEGRGETTSMPNWERKAKALELGIMYKDKIGTDKKVSEMADVFLNFMED